MRGGGGEFDSITITPSNKEIAVPRNSNDSYIVGYNTTLTLNSTHYNNIILSNNCKLIKNGSINGTIITANNCTIEGSGFGGNVILGSNNKLQDTTISSNFIVGNESSEIKNNTFNAFTTFSSNYKNIGNTFYGVSAFGIYSNIQSGFIHSPSLIGYGSTISANNIAAPLLLGSACSINANSLKSIVIAGHYFKTDDSVDNQYSTWIINSFNDIKQNIDNFINRRGLILTGLSPYSVFSGASYFVYWPNNSCYAEHHGNIRYADDMNIMDKDGQYIIRNGELNVEHPTIVAKINELIDVKLAQL